MMLQPQSQSQSYWFFLLKSTFFHFSAPAWVYPCCLPTLCKHLIGLLPSGPARQKPAWHTWRRATFLSKVTPAESSRAASFPARQRFLCCVTLARYPVSLPSSCPSASLYFFLFLKYLNPLPRFYSPCCITTIVASLPRRLNSLQVNIVSAHWCPLSDQDGARLGSVDEWDTSSLGTI
jgi:hypothetical protein